MTTDTGQPDAMDQARSTRGVRMALRLESSPERAFRAWSEPAELARWLPDRIEGSLGVGTRSVLRSSGGEVWWDMLEVHASDTVVFRRPWNADEGVVTTVRITVHPVGYGTRLELDDGPFEIDTADGLEAWATAIRTWAEAMTMLRAYLDFSVDVRRRR